MTSRSRPYLGQYNIMLYTLDESIPYLFINIQDLTRWIYKEPGEKEFKNIREKIRRIRIIKKVNHNRRCCIVANSVKYEVALVKAN